MKHILINKKRQILKIYFISYLAVALLILTITGMASNLLFSQELFQAQKDAVQEKLALANESLKKQLGVLEEIVVLSSLDSKFAPVSFQRGISYEMEMMKYLESYKNYFPLDFSYYFYYPELNSVYSYNAKYTMEDFLSYIHPQYRKNILQGMEQTELLLAADEKTALLTFDRTILRRPYYVFFFVPVEELTEYVASMAGIEAANLYLQIAGRDVSAAGEYVYQQPSAFGVSVMLCADLEQPLQQFIGKMMPLLIVLSLVCLAIAVYFSYRNYQPIQKLINQYHLDLQENLDEFALIDHHLAVVTMENNQSQEKLQEMTRLLYTQECMLRRQLLRQVLHQGLTASLRDALKNVHISFPGQFTALVRIQGDGTEWQGDLSKEIEGLSSSENMVFYALPQENEEFLFTIINTLDRADIFSAVDLLHILLHDSLSLQLLGVRDTLESLPTLGHYMDSERQEDGTGSDMTRNESKIDDIIAEVESGNEKEAVAYVHEMELEMELAESNSNDVRSQRVELVSRLYQMTLQYNLASARDQIVSGILIANSTEEYLSAVIFTIRALCRLSAGKEGSRRSANVLCYIHEHLGDWELSLESLANVFQVSSRIISADIKSVTGMNYMEYVKAERMKRACKLLEETEDSVMEIGNAIGYINISYFIRVFREYTGMTPSIYRNTADSLKQED